MSCDASIQSRGNFSRDQWQRFVNSLQEACVDLPSLLRADAANHFKSGFLQHGQTLARNTRIWILKSHHNTSDPSID